MTTVSAPETGEPRQRERRRGTGTAPPDAPVPPRPPVVSWPLRPGTRRHLDTLAECAAFLDRTAHAPATGPGDPSAELDAFEADLDALYSGGGPRHPVVSALAPTVLGLGLPAQPLRRMVAGARAQRAAFRFDTAGQVVEHCHLVADPLGELTLHVLGAATPDRVALSDFLCTGAWLAGYLPRVGGYWRAGRCYLAKEDLDRFGAVPSDLARDRVTDGLRVLLAGQAQRARAFLDSGAPLVSTLRGRARVAVGGHLAAARSALADLERRGYDPLHGSARVGTRATLAQWLRGTLRTPG